MRFKIWLRRIVTGLGGIVLISAGLVACNSLPQTLGTPAVDTIRLASYNVHYIILSSDTGAWSVGDWERRKVPMQKAFETINADVIAFQEMESFARGSGGNTNLTLSWLLDQNPDYAAAAVGDPAEFPSTQPILYRSSRVALLDQGWFFFSETPDVIYSRTFNGSFPAFASWADFRDLMTNQTFTVVNIHTDYASIENRAGTANLLVERIGARIEAGNTVLLAGDFNARPGAATLETIAQAGITFWPVQGSTYHFNTGLNLFGPIDHLAGTSNTMPIRRPVAIRQKFDGEWPTDHYPIVGDIRLTP